MFGGLGMAVRSFVTDLIKIALLIALLVAIVAYCKANPETAQQLVNKVANTGAALIIAGCDQVVEWLGPA